MLIIFQNICFLAEDFEVENHSNVSYFITNSNLVAKKLKLESKAKKLTKILIIIKYMH